MKTKIHYSFKSLFNLSLSITTQTSFITTASHPTQKPQKAFFHSFFYRLSYSNCRSISALFNYARNHTNIHWQINSLPKEISHIIFAQICFALYSFDSLTFKVLHAFQAAVFVSRRSLSSRFATVSLRELSRFFFSFLPSAQN